jgi:molybdopterin-guanine dinucleotide biosynthesis protein B
MNSRTPGFGIPVLGICSSASNAGKTTLITRLITVLAQRSIRVSVIKHAHHQFDIDYPGKDSYHIREAGAVQTLIASGNRWALMTEMYRTPDRNNEADLQSLIAELNPHYADLILVEGFKQASIPKIEVFRPSLALPLLADHDTHIIAIASDAHIDNHLPVLALNAIDHIADFIQHTFLANQAITS